MRLKTKKIDLFKSLKNGKLNKERCNRTREGVWAEPHKKLSKIK